MQSTEAQAKFNAGVDTALYINQLLKEAGYYAKVNDFPNWHKTLKELHRWVSPKLKKEEMRKELEDKSNDKNGVLIVYQRKASRNKKIPANVSYKLFDFLTEYEIGLRKCLDKYGYQMPDLEDPRWAL